jgi:hypothetical protein
MAAGDSQPRDLAEPDGSSRDPTTDLADSEALLDLRDDEPLVDLRDAPSLRFGVPHRLQEWRAASRTARRLAYPPAAIERRDSLERSRLAAVITIAALNGVDLVTTYVAIARGAHEANPIVAWMISSHAVVVAKIAICASLVIGAVVAKRRKLRVSLAGLCTAWAVVGVYSLVVVINTLTVLGHVR